MKSKNLILKSEAKKLVKTAKKIAKLIGKIDALHIESRKIVGFENLEVPFIEENEIVWSDDSSELSESMIEWCMNNRTRWYGEVEYVSGMSDMKNNTL
jgi:hypothetical protein